MASRLRWGVAIVALMLVGFLVGMGSMFVYTEYVDTPDEPLDEETVEAKILEQVNKIRVEADLTQLEADRNLTRLARAHGEDMSEREFVDHVNPDGEGPHDRADGEAACVSVGENLAQTWWDEPIEADDGGSDRLTSNAEMADWLVEQWMDSPGHRENILNEHWTKTGIGVVSEGGQVFATQKFCS